MVKLFGRKKTSPIRKMKEEVNEDNPPGYEGKEHVKYRDPGFSPHHIRFPDDEPHMKSHATMEEEHEAEDDYHMDIPDQTAHSLPGKIKRARMKMDSPNYDEPAKLRGNMVRSTPQEGAEDTSGEEEMGPNEYQHASKEKRKKMVISVMKRKMRKNRY